MKVKPVLSFLGFGWAILFFMFCHASAQIKTEEYLRALIYPQKGNAVSGYVTKIENDTIVLLTMHGDNRVAFIDVHQVTVLSEGNITSKGFIYGATLGLYLGPLLDAGLPEWFLAAKGGNLGLAGASLVSLGLGGILGGIGYLIDPPSESENVYDFSGDSETKRKEMERLADRLVGVRSIARVHFSVSGGQVFPVVSDRAKEMLAQKGYDFLDRKSNFNWLRKAQLTYSFAPEFELGTAIVWFGEPAILGENFHVDSLRQRHFFESQQSLSSTGYYVVMSYSFTKVRFEGNLGIGIGVAKVKFHMNTEMTFDDFSNSTFTRLNPRYDMSRSGFSETMFLDIRYRLHDAISFGLYADYTLANVGESEIPAVPEADLPGQTLKFRNGCIGIVTKLDF